MPTAKDKLQALVNLQKDMEEKEHKRLEDALEAQKKTEEAAKGAGTPEV